MTSDLIGFGLLLVGYGTFLLDARYRRSTMGGQQARFRMTLRSFAWGQLPPTQAAHSRRLTIVGRIAFFGSIVCWIVSIITRFAPHRGRL
jgi:hypothetical protein